MFQNNLLQIIPESTHLLGGVLDLILSNSPDRIMNITINTPNLSDRSIITFDMLNESPSPKVDVPEFMLKRIIQAFLTSWKGFFFLFLSMTAMFSGDVFVTHLITPVIFLFLIRVFLPRPHLAGSMVTSDTS